MVQFSCIYLWDYNQNLLLNPFDLRLFNFHETKKNQNPLSVHVNLTTSSHFNQYDFIMYNRMRRLFNFHKIKENQNTLWCIWAASIHEIPNKTCFQIQLMWDYLIPIKQQKKNQNSLLVHVNFTTSTHSNQYDFIMPKWMRKLLNFHETKENYNTL